MSSRSNQRRRKKVKKKVTGDTEESDDVKLAPHSFIFSRGKVSKGVEGLVENWRKVMSPYTASHLKISKKNVLKDCVANAGPLHVSHMIVFSQTEKSSLMKVIKLPAGPTVYFKISKFSLINQVMTSVRGASTADKIYAFQPLVATENFDSKLHHKISSSLLQNMFPKLNLETIEMKKIKRCVLFSYNSETDSIEFRHYRIKVLLPDISRGVQKIAGPKPKIPDLSDFKDISEYVKKMGNLSGGESDVELTQMIESANPTSCDENAKAEGPPAKRKRLTPRSRKAVRLVEIGPRMELKLYKIEQGIAEGEVIYHSLFCKTAAEKDALILKHKFIKKKPKHQFSENNPNAIKTDSENVDEKNRKN